MVNQNSTQEFGKLRSLLWPVHGYELKKLLPMFFIFFCISFNYTILRDTKDSLIMTAPGSGAEALPFLKVWCVVPAAIVLLLIYSKLANMLSKERLFYSMLLPFIAFFALFGLVIYPLRDVLHPSASADWLAAFLPNSAASKGVVAIYRNWTFGLFYILAELWGSMVLSMMFWGFANDITKTNEAKRFYGLLGIGANIALIFSGQAIIWASPGAQDRPFAQSLQALMGMVTLAGFCIIAVYWWMQREVLTDPRFFDEAQLGKKKKEKPKLGIGASVRYLSRSKYLGCVAFIVMAYGASINLIETIWKSQVKLAYPTAAEYTNFMGHFSAVTGAVTLFMFFFVSHNVIRRFGWTTAALVTPLVLAITGVIFLNFVVFRDYFIGYLAVMGTSPLMMAVYFGAAQNIMSKSSKYSLFDPTKEMAYIPLDQESKIKGKAAIDVVGARLGKSGGSFVQQFLMLFLPSAVAMAPYVGAAFLLMAGGWLVCVKKLGRLYEQRVREQESEESQSQAATSSSAAVPAATT